MSNNEIIYKTALLHGFTAEQLGKLIESYGHLPFHTFAEWKTRGYVVKKGEHAIFKAELWKFTNKLGKAMVKKAKDAGKDIPEESPHYYLKTSHLFSALQVEPLTKSI